MKRMRNRMLLFLTQKEVREKRRIRQAEIASALGVSPNTIGNWIRDEITQIDTNVLLGLCDYFGVTFDQLLYVTNGACPVCNQFLVRKSHNRPSFGSHNLVIIHLSVRICGSLGNLTHSGLLESSMDY